MDALKTMQKRSTQQPVKLCGSKTEVGVLLARLKRVSYKTHTFIKPRYQCVILYQYGWALKFPYPNVRLTIYRSISL